MTSNIWTESECGADFLAQKLGAGGTCLHCLMVNPPLIQCITRSWDPLKWEILCICTALTKRALVRNVPVWWQSRDALIFVLVLVNAKTQTNQQNLKGKSAQTYKVNYVIMKKRAVIGRGVCLTPFSIRRQLTRTGLVLLHLLQPFLRVKCTTRNQKVNLCVVWYFNTEDDIKY